MKIKKFLIILTISLLSTLFSSAFAQTTLEVLVQKPTYNKILLSPDGQKIAAQTNENGKTLLSFYSLAPIELKYVLDYGELLNVGDFTWVNNDRVITQVTHTGGSLDIPFSNGTINGINFDGSEPKELFGTPARGVTRGFIQDNSGDSGTATFVDAMYDEDESVLINTFPIAFGFGNTPAPFGDVYKLNVNTGKKSKVSRLPRPGAQAFADHNHDIRLATAINTDGKTELFTKAGSKWNQIGTNAAVIQPIGFSADNSQAFLLSDNQKNYTALYSIDLESFQQTEIYRDESADINADDIIWNPDKTEPLGLKIEANYPTYRFFNTDDKFAQFFISIVKTFQGQRVEFENFSQNGKQGILKVSSDGHPGKFYLADLENQKLSYLTSAAAWLDNTKLAMQEAFSVDTPDGFTLNGFVTFPIDGSEADLPMIVMPHNGPNGRDRWDYNQDAQVLANAGYAVLQVNYRGSTGYGQALLNAANENSDADIQNDIALAANWAVQAGIADKDKMCIYGSGFGAYIALMGAITQDNLYQCAIGYAGTYDFQIPGFGGGFGGFRAPSENSTEFKPSPESPAGRASEITIPVFLAHGQLDIAAPISVAKGIIEDLQSSGVENQWLAVEDEAHGFNAQQAQLEYYTQLLSFLERHLD